MKKVLIHKYQEGRNNTIRSRLTLWISGWIKKAEIANSAGARRDAIAKGINKDK